MQVLIWSRGTHCVRIPLLSPFRYVCGKTALIWYGAQYCSPSMSKQLSIGFRNSSRVFFLSWLAGCVWNGLNKTWKLTKLMSAWQRMFIPSNWHFMTFPKSISGFKWQAGSANLHFCWGATWCTACLKLNVNVHQLNINGMLACACTTCGYMTRCSTRQSTICLQKLAFVARSNQSTKYIPSSPGKVRSKWYVDTLKHTAYHRLSKLFEQTKSEHTHIHA